MVLGLALIDGIVLSDDLVDDQFAVEPGQTGGQDKLSFSSVHSMHLGLILHVAATCCTS